MPPLAHAASTEQLPEKSPEKWDSTKSAWDHLQNHEEPGERVIFDEICIAVDGGISEIGDAKLWYNSRYFSSVLLLVFVAYNMYFLISFDVSLIMERMHKEFNPHEHWLVSKYILDLISPNFCVEHEISPKTWITGIELVILAVHVCVLMQDVIAARFKTGYKKWKGVAEICWIDLPQLSIFSAMKLLEYIVPQKISYDINFAIWYATGSKVWNVAVILMTRPLALIVGMDMFLVKYRMVVPNIGIPGVDKNGTDLSKPDPTMHDIMAGLIFLNQVIGVCNLNFTIRSRLYRFVFGGEDGVMTEEEMVRQDVWEASVAAKVFEAYPRYQAAALMLSWCDDDFQMLTLNDKYAQAHGHGHAEHSIKAHTSISAKEPVEKGRGCGGGESSCVLV